MSEAEPGPRRVAGSRRGRSGWRAPGLAGAAALAGLTATAAAAERPGEAPARLVSAAVPPSARFDRPIVTVRIPDELPCLAGVDRAVVRRLLAIELGAQLTTDADAAARGGVTRAAVTCDGPWVELDVDDPVTGKTLRRGIDLERGQEPAPGRAVGPSRADDALAPSEFRARLLALALAELVFASWAELLVTPHPHVPPVAPPVPPEARAATSARVSQMLPRPLGASVPVADPGGIRLMLLAGASVLLTTPEWLGGGGLRVGGDHGRSLSWDLDAQYQRGRASTALGMVTTDLISGRLALLASTRLPLLTLRAGAGLRLGAAHLSGTPADARAALGSQLWGVWGGPLVDVGLSVPGGNQRLRIDVGLEAGYVVWPVGARVGGVRAVSVEGPWLGLVVGVGARVSRPKPATTPPTPTAPTATTDAGAVLSQPRAQTPAAPGAQAL